MEPSAKALSACLGCSRATALLSALQPLRTGAQELAAEFTSKGDAWVAVSGACLVAVEQALTASSSLVRALSGEEEEGVRTAVRLVALEVLH